MKNSTRVCALVGASLVAISSSVSGEQGKTDVPQMPGTAEAGSKEATDMGKGQNPPSVTTIDPNLAGTVAPTVRTATWGGHIAVGRNEIFLRHQTDTIVVRLNLTGGVHMLAAKVVVVNMNATSRVSAGCRLWRDESDMASADPTKKDGLDTASMKLEPSGIGTVSLLGAVQLADGETVVPTVSCGTSIEGDGLARWAKITAVQTGWVERQ